MKKRLISVAIAAITLCTMVGCSQNSNKENSDAKSLKVGMVTDSGTIDDKSFNQGTWEGIQLATDELNITSAYVKPAGTTASDYLTEITNLYDADYSLIITPGYQFENAVYIAQEQYKDAKFILIDGTPNDGEGNSNVAENTVSVYFAEHEAGFIAGVATALKIKDGDVGFLGGAPVPAVQKYNWGFQQGIKYANDNFGTTVSMKKENFIYEGTFTNTAGGQQIAAAMYDRGVKAIFAAAGSGGVGAISEAKTRALNGEEVWIIGVDVDQYDSGLYNDTDSVILTSAVKKLAQASYSLIESELNNNFPSGETVIFDITNDGVGIPSTNPNLDADIEEKIALVTKELQSNTIKVSDTSEGLIE